MRNRLFFISFGFFLSAFIGHVYAAGECRLQYNRSDNGLAPIGVIFGKLGTERITLNAGKSKTLKVSKSGEKKRGYGNHLRRAKNIGQSEVKIYIKDIRNHWVTLKPGKGGVFQADLKRVSCPGVVKDQRELLIFLSNLAPEKPGTKKVFYKFVEFSAEKLAIRALSKKYRAVRVVKGKNASKASLSNHLNSITRKSGVKAVDVIFVTHGLNEGVAFSDKTVTIGEVRDDIKKKLSTQQRKKLRALFSTACYGSSHRKAWLEAGFKVASGSRRIYADSAASYPAFLGSWKAEKSFRAAVNAANKSDPAHVQDKAGKQLLKHWGYSKWYDVNSERVISGRSGINLNSAP